jgi:hypothetical protein
VDEIQIHVHKPTFPTDGVHSMSTLLPFAFTPSDLGAARRHGLFSGSLVELPLTIPKGNVPARSVNLAKLGNPPRQSSGSASPQPAIATAGSGQANGGFVEVSVDVGIATASMLTPSSPLHSPLAKRARASLPVSEDYMCSVRAHAALAAAQSHAPYSQCPAGIAASCDDGTVVVASSYESCAYNPSLSLLQSLMVGMVLEFRSSSEINPRSSPNETTAGEIKTKSIETLRGLLSKLNYVCVLEQTPPAGAVGVAHGDASESVLLAAGAHALFDVLRVPAAIAHKGT